MYQKVFIFLIIPILFSCQKNKPNSFKKRSIRTDIIEFNIDKIKFETEIWDSLIYDRSYIALETNKDALINEITKLIVKGDTMFILDNGPAQQAIFAYTTTGKFLFKINKRGKGVGEYIQISDFFIDEKNEAIGILDHGKILKYGFDGSYKELLDLRKHSIVNVIQKDSFIYCSCRPNDKNEYPLLVSVFNLNGKLLYKDHPVDKRIANFALNKKNYLAIDSDAAYVNLLCSDTIYSFDYGHITPKYVLDFGKYKIPPDELSDLLDKGALDSEFRRSYFKKSGNVEFGLYDFYSTTKFLVLHYPISDKLNTVIFSKETRNLKGFRLKNKQSSIDLLNRYSFKKFDEDYFYGVLPINYALSIHKTIKNNLGKNSNFLNTKEKKEQFEILNQLTPNSNPIIMIYKLRTF